MYETEEKTEKAIAISVAKKSDDRAKALEHLDELEFLAETAGADVIEKMYQELARPNPGTLVGKGKLEEIRLFIEEHEITLAIFDNDLSPVQVKNLSNELKVKVLDRSGIILDIFASRARSIEAKTQVELAQLQYLLPRLTRMWTHLSKQYGGIGTKGPGETQIETDRRIIKTRIQLLEDKLVELDTQKEVQRKNRRSMPRFALVGYTNAGKSTLMNALTEAEVYVEDKLFATLDTTVRAFELPSGRKALLSDTVGFIRKLPHHLVASFRSTLSEAADADILLHVVDVSHPAFREQIAVVNETLESLKIVDKPVILILNKIDMLEGMEGLRQLEEDFANCIFTSAKRGINIRTLLDKMQEEFDKQSSYVNILLPYEKMELIAKLYSVSDIVERADGDEGITLRLLVHPDGKGLFDHHFSEFQID